MAASKTLFESWQNPPSIYRSAPFWSWNSKLDPDRLCRAIESMHGAGMGGFFMHSRYGLKTPYLSEEWFRCITACIEKAQQLGMKAYLYDEDRWPSGAAGGLVTRPHKEFRTHNIVASAANEPAPEAERLAVFAIRKDADGRLTGYEPVEEGSVPAGTEFLAFDIQTSPPSGWYNDGAYLDTMNPDAVAEFIRVTHRAYADRYQKYFGDVVPGIFTDEPNYGNAFEFVTKNGLPATNLHWTPALPREFKRRRGYDLREKLPELFLGSADGSFSRARCDYYRTITELFVEGFAKQIGQWCHKHGLALTGHWLAEESLGSQCDVIGAAMPHYEFEQWPGIDILCDSAYELQTVKQCTSVADQLGKPRVLSELYGCTGWDWPLEGHKFIGDWQFASGVNFRCPHLAHYSLAGGAKRDYPASIFAHSPWWKHYHLVEGYFGRLSYMLTQGKPQRDVLVIHPIESAWGMFWPGQKDSQEPQTTGPGSVHTVLQQPLTKLIYALSRQHYDWDFGDESLMARHCSVAKGVLKVGKMSYRLVIVPPTVTLRSSTVKLLQKFQADGRQVLFVGRKPELIDAQPSNELAGMTVSSASCGDKAEDFLPAIEKLLPRRIRLTENGKEQECLWAMLRYVTAGQAGSRRSGQLLFVQSHDRKAGHRIHVNVEGHGPAVLWDALTGTQRMLESKEESGRVEFDLALPASGSALVSLGLTVRSAAKPAAPLNVVDRKEICGPFDIRMEEPNTLPLDYCTFRVGDEPWSEPVPSLKVDTEIRKRFGLDSRQGWEHQPWYLYAMGTVDVRPRGQAQTRRVFHVTDVPAQCKVAIEMPEAFQITLNGRKVGIVDGWWVDEDIKTIDITSLIRAGENELLLAFDYRPDMELEDVYLVGNFGVTPGATRPPTKGKDSLLREAGNISLIAPPKQLKLGSWVGQGLDFYGGAVSYRMNVTHPGGGNRVRVCLPGIACTAAAIHVGTRTFALPWAPFEADITDALAPGENEIFVEVIGGRKNVMGPLHTPWEAWTGPQQFSPYDEEWIREYCLMNHGLTAPVIVEALQ